MYLNILHSSVTAVGYILKTMYRVLCKKCKEFPRINFTIHGSSPYCHYILLTFYMNYLTHQTMSPLAIWPRKHGHLAKQWVTIAVVACWTTSKHCFLL